MERHPKIELIALRQLVGPGDMPADGDGTLPRFQDQFDGERHAQRPVLIAKAPQPAKTEIFGEGFDHPRLVFWIEPHR